MTARRLPAERDPVRPGPATAVTVTFDGRRVEGLAGQTVAGVLLADGTVAWRRSVRTGRPRGVFCGIGTCWDCLIVVNGLPDVRACQRRAADGDVLESQGPTRADDRRASYPEPDAPSGPGRHG